MAYEFVNSKGIKYYLHFKDVNLKGGRLQRIYYFARDVRPGSLDEVPAGYRIVETERNSMPILKAVGPHGPKKGPPKPKKPEKKKK